MEPSDDTKTTAIFIGPKRAVPRTVGDRLDQLFLAWAWYSRAGEWEDAVWTLARALKGLEGEDLIERRRVRGEDGRVLHLVRLTPRGETALRLLRGDDSELREAIPD